MSKVLRFWNNVQQTADPYVFEDDDAQEAEDHDMEKLAKVSKSPPQMSCIAKPS